VASPVRQGSSSIFDSFFAFLFSKEVNISPDAPPKAVPLNGHLESKTRKIYVCIQVENKSPLTPLFIKIFTKAPTQNANPEKANETVFLKQPFINSQTPMCSFSAFSSERIFIHIYQEQNRNLGNQSVSSSNHKSKPFSLIKSIQVQEGIEKYTLLFDKANELRISQSST